MKKKVLFVLVSFGIGGTSVSTKNLILSLDAQRYDIYVMPMKRNGVLSFMFDDVKQIDTPFVVSSLSYGSWKDERNPFKRPFCALLRCISKLIPGFKRQAFVRAAETIMKRYHFDTVAACQENKVTQFVQYFDCRNKVAWIRSDYYRMANWLSTKRQEKGIYDKYDSIICVSEIMTEHFLDIFPEFRHKTYTINNPQNGEYIKRQSINDDHDARYSKNGFTIISIGRFAPVKRFSHIPGIARKLVDKGLTFKWFIVGGANNKTESTLIAKETEKHGMGENVICLGVKDNPHFYIANSDLLVCLSSSEACPRVINEAKILHVPVVCTDFDSAKEFIQDGINGIVRNIDTIDTAIYETLTDKELYNNIRSNISDFEFDNTNLLEPLYKIL